MYQLSFGLCAASIIYGVIAFVISVEPNARRLRVIQLNLIGMALSSVAALGLMAGLIDDPDMPGVASLLLMAAVVAVCCIHTWVYAANRPASKEEGRKLAGR